MPFLLFFRAGGSFFLFLFFSWRHLFFFVASLGNLILPPWFVLADLLLDLPFFFAD